MPKCISQPCQILLAAILQHHVDAKQHDFALQNVRCVALVPLEYGSMCLPVLILSHDSVLLSSRTSQVKFLQHIAVATNCSFRDYVARYLSSQVVSLLKGHFSRSNRTYARERRKPTESTMENAVGICHCSEQPHTNEPCSTRSATPCLLANKSDEKRHGRIRIQSIVLVR